MTRKAAFPIAGLLECLEQAPSAIFPKLGVFDCFGWPLPSSIHILRLLEHFD